MEKRHVIILNHIIAKMAYDDYEKFENSRQDLQVYINQLEDINLDLYYEVFMPDAQLSSSDIELIGILNAPDSYHQVLSIDWSSMQIYSQVLSTSKYYEYKMLQSRKLEENQL